MNTPNDIRWLMFATVPVSGYINLATPITRGILWLWRHAIGYASTDTQRAPRNAANLLSLQPLSWTSRCHSAPSRVALKTSRHSVVDTAS